MGGPNRVTDGYGTIGGGVGNRAGDAAGEAWDASYATVGGGGRNEAEGEASTVGGGAWNWASGAYSTVGGGLSNKATANYATIGGGGPSDEADASTSNRVTDNYGTIGGGGNNVAGDEAGTDARYATVGGGGSNRANAAYATVPGGQGAQADQHGQMAYASGSFAEPGDAQAGLYVLRAETTPGVGRTRLFLDGAGKELTIASGRTVAFDILVVARSEDSESAGYTIQGVVEHHAPPGIRWEFRFVGTPSVTTLAEDDPSWGLEIEINSQDGTLSLWALGESSIRESSVRWVATVRTSEVAQEVPPPILP